MWAWTAARRGILAALAACLFLTAPLDVFAAERARLSADLAAHLAAGSVAIDVIVHGNRVQVNLLAARYNLRVTKYLKTGAVLRVTAGQLAALQMDGSQDHLSSDIQIRSTANVTAETILADRVWTGSDGLDPLSGAGIGIAIIDSGVDPDHVALRNRVPVSVDFTGGNGIDRYGHGTHVAAIIAGQSGAGFEPDDYRGIAPGAHIISLRVLNDRGNGRASSVIEAIDWAIDHREMYHIRIINISIGAPVLQPYRDDPLCEAVERAIAAGMFVVASAGNAGRARDGTPMYGDVTSPGNDPNVITVGALDMHGTPDRLDDTVADYSSRGPTMYDVVMKPDLVAPGNNIVSAEASGSWLRRSRPGRHVTGAGPNAYMRLSGTSMAAGVVTGALALLLERAPQLTAVDAKAILQATCWLMPEGIAASGSGSLDVFGAAQLLEAIARGDYVLPAGAGIGIVWPIGEATPQPAPVWRAGFDDTLDTGPSRARNYLYVYALYVYAAPWNLCALVCPTLDSRQLAAKGVPTPKSGQPLAWRPKT